jgi:tetratricopeptide (TPR) repeat protein
VDLAIDYPLDETLFPPESVPPTFRWEDGRSNSDAWLVTIEFDDGGNNSSYPSQRPEWTPSAEQWEEIKRRSLRSKAKVTILGGNRALPERILSVGGISFGTSDDEVGAPIFYREVNLPFIDAVKDPSRIRWRFGAISSTTQPPVVLENLPVCGNCHSFSADGSILGMDVDYANDKGSYAIAPVAEEIVLDKSKIITWADYKREDETPTFGLLAQVSPDGRYVVSTVKDQSVFVPKPDLTFSQLFFPIQGILVVYDRQTGTFNALPGADDAGFVQSNPTWSPDGKYIVFARSSAYRLKNVRERRSALLTPQDCTEFLAEGKKFLFDLYRIPFNGGKGGKAEPLEGASRNGMSNYFARYSPDGKWIVFCRAASYMLLQPDSELYIVRAEGGEARRLRCNTRRMNSWHSWSPNGKWLVFSSKANSAYTQLFLTHINEEGRSTPPVLLSHFTSPDRAANIPEFVNISPDALAGIREAFVDDYSYARAGSETLKYGDPASAEVALRKALKINPRNANAHNNLGTILAERGFFEEAWAHFREAIEADPNQRDSHSNLGSVLIRQGKLEEAILQYREALRLDPGFFLSQMKLAMALSEAGHVEEANEHLLEAGRLAPDDPLVHYQLGLAWHTWGKAYEAAKHYELAVKHQPDFLPALVALASIRALSTEPELRDPDEAVRLAERASEVTHRQDPVVLDALAEVYATVGRFRDAISAATMALQIAESVKAEDLANSLRKRLKDYQQRDTSGQMQAL